MGYSRPTAKSYVKKMRREKRNHAEIAANHNYKQGYFKKSMIHYNAQDSRDIDYIKDIDYIAMRPYNNSLKKNISNMISARYFFGEDSFLPKIYANIIRRDGANIIFSGDQNKKLLSNLEFVELIKKGPFILKPSFFDASLPEQVIYYSSKYKGIFVRSCDEIGNDYSWDYFRNKYKINFVLIDPLNMKLHHLDRLEIYIGNSLNVISKPDILEIALHRWSDEEERYVQYAVNVKNGFVSGDVEDIGPVVFNKILKTIKPIINKLNFLNYYSISFMTDNDTVRFHSFAITPDLPEYPFSNRLNNFLLKLYEVRYLSNKPAKKSYTKVISERLLKEINRAGTRTYMQKLWLMALKDDLFNTKKIPFSTKLWAWKRGFLSFRVHQYGLTDENYNNYLSDYDYIWLNRINGLYGCFIDDKVVFRYTFEKFKHFLPEYYFLVTKKFGKTQVITLPDYKGTDSPSVNSIIKLLKKEGILAFKPSAGLHGDGFYRLEYIDNGFLVNGKERTEEELIELIESQRSFYIVTDYLFMSDDLRPLYPNSINTIRMMVVNNRNNQPRILQTYMRIGSSSSGFTDNVAYGGICANVDVESGHFHGGQRLFDHFYEECPIHPDTNMPIDGYIRGWKVICQNVIEMAKHVGELDYLGFDVVISNKGMKVLEINLHQDLHKVAEYTNDINDFFKRKIRIKSSINNIKKINPYGGKR